MAFFAKFRRKLRTKNFEAHFHRKLRTIEKCSNVKKLRTAEPQPIFTGSYKIKKILPQYISHSLQGFQKWFSKKEMYLWKQEMVIFLNIHLNNGA